MSYPKYKIYKDSGVDWLGKLPEHWEIDRIKRSIVSAKNGIWGDEPQHDESDIPCVRVADFDRQALRVELSEPTIRNVIEKERVGRVLVKGDLLLEKSGGGENQPVGCVVLYDDLRPAVCSNFVARVQTAKNMNSSFWRYVHAAAYAVQINTKSIKQTSGIQNLDASAYFDERAGFPPLFEQNQIAAFLDRETVKIDDLSKAFESLISLLKEKRQAVISHAVTKGLDPSVPMKDSGIGWLGNIPSHWEMKRLKYLGEAITGLTYSPNDIVDEGCGTLVLRSSNVQNGKILLGDNVFVSAQIPENLVTRVGDILICSRNGSRALIGKNATIDQNSEGLTFGAFMTVFRSDDSAYIGCILNSPLFDFQAGAFMTSTINQLTLGVLNNFEIPLPPPDEREAIAAFLECENAQFNDLINEAISAIGLLQERRTALISAAVTGKIDVRGLVNVDTEEKIKEAA